MIPYVQLKITQLRKIKVVSGKIDDNEQKLMT